MKKRLLSAILALLLVCGMFGSVPMSGYAAELNASSVTLYALDQWETELLAIPDGYPSEFQLEVTGASYVSYYSDGNVNVSADGLITPKVTVWYWYGGLGSTMPMSGYGEPTRITRDVEFGTFKVYAYADGKTLSVSVTVTDYGTVYTDRQMDAYLAENITDTMTVYEKLDALCRFVAGFDYSPYYSSAEGMILSGGGDCWASTDMLVRMCEKIGIQCIGRNGNRDPGAGSGHRNALAIIEDGVYYELEAGYSGSAPRVYSITPRTSLFSYSYVSGGISVYQYDGPFDGLTTLTVPETIDGNTVVAIGSRFIQLEAGVEEVVLPATVKSIGESAFNSCTGLKKLELPASVTSIGSFAFTCCSSLTEWTVAPGSKSFEIENGILYNCGKTLLISAPCCEEAVIPDTVQTIGQYSFYYNGNLSRVSIPASVTAICEGAFGDCPNLVSVTFAEGSGLRMLDSFAFYQDDALKSMVIPAGCETLADYSVGILYATTAAAQVTEGFILFGTAGTPAQAYAEAWNIPFVDVSAGGWIELEGGRKYFRGSSFVTGWNRIDGQCLYFDADGFLTEGVSNEILRDEKHATCTENGFTGNVYCVCCGELLRAGQTIEAPGHDYVNHPAKPATCAEAGWDAYRTCSRCDYTEFSEIPAIAHRNRVEREAQPATCLEPGYEAGVWCPDCQTWLSGHAQLPALGHDMSYKVTQVPTVTAAGVLTGECARCTGRETVVLPRLNPEDYTLSVLAEASCTATGLERYVWNTLKYGRFSFDVTVPKKAHDYTTTVTPPTCAGKGYATHICINCGDTYTDSYTEALGHDFINHAAKPATCTEAGWDAYRTCSRCDYNSYVEIAAFGHDYVPHSGKAATCTEAGWYAYETCSRCDYTTFDEIPAYGHDYIGHEAQAPTCTEPGWDAYRTCSRCDFSDYHALPALNHDWVPDDENSRAPTCTEPGFGTIKCTRCGETKSGETDPLGHDYADHPAQAPTCTEPGWDAYRTCSRCDYTEYAEQPATGHDYADHPAQAPTCTEPGWDAYRTCSRCDYTEFAEKPELGHADDDGDGLCDRCGLRTGEPPQPSDPCEGFTDVNRSLWYHSAVDFVIGRGLMGSTKTNALTFEPNTRVSRAMVASILYRMADSPAVECRGAFTDVQPGAWYATAVEWCALNGLASGKGAGIFDPMGNVTRQELAVFMKKMADYMGRDTSGRANLNGFPDNASVPAWAKTYLEWAVDAKLISGKQVNGTTLLAPAETASRAELASILMRFVQ